MFPSLPEIEEFVSIYIYKSETKIVLFLAKFRQTQECQGKKIMK